MLPRWFCIWSVRVLSSCRYLRWLMLRVSLLILAFGLWIRVSIVSVCALASLTCLGLRCSTIDLIRWSNDGNCGYLSCITSCIIVSIILIAMLNLMLVVVDHRHSLHLCIRGTRWAWCHAHRSLWRIIDKIERLVIVHIFVFKQGYDRILPVIIIVRIVDVIVVTSVLLILDNLHNLLSSWSYVSSLNLVTRAAIQDTHRWLLV